MGDKKKSATSQIFSAGLFYERILYVDREAPMSNMNIEIDKTKDAGSFSNPFYIRIFHHFN